jgi:hypothetical protein
LRSQPASIFPIKSCLTTNNQKLNHSLGYQRLSLECNHRLQSRIDEMGSETLEKWLGSLSMFSYRWLVTIEKLMGPKKYVAAFEKHFTQPELMPEDTCCVSMQT